MSLKLVLALLAVSGLVGIAFGYFLRWIISLGKRGSMELEIKQMMLDAQEKAKKITEESEQRARDKEEVISSELKEKERNLKQMEERLIRKEEMVDQRQQNVDSENESLKERAAELATMKEQSQALMLAQQEKLEKVANLTKDEAKAELLASIEKQYEHDLESRMRKLEVSGNEKLEARAKEILTTSVHRLGNSVVSDVLATTVSIPNDEIKGKIIGKEGRNIRTFEKMTGADVIVDDTPGTITLSCYDPVRRQIARIALENLILDGRIQPAKIEEAVQKAEQEINNII